MASSSDVVKKVTRFKLQLTDTAESATVLKVLQKLKDLDITVEILAETGIGKTVNAFRRHGQAGEFAKSLVKGWKKLLSKDCTSLKEERDVSATMSVKDKLDVRNSSDTTGFTAEDLNNNCLTSHRKSQDSSDEALCSVGPYAASSKVDLEKRCEERKEKNWENEEKSPQETQSISQSVLLANKMEEDLFASKKKKHDQSGRKSRDGNTLLGDRNSEDSYRRAKPDSREKLKINTDGGRLKSEKESNKKVKPKKEGKGSFSSESNDKHPKTLKLADLLEEKSSGTAGSPDAKKRKRKKTSKEKHICLDDNQESENKRHSEHKNKRAKIKRQDKESDGERHGPSMSFESYLNYDVNVMKKKERSGAKKPSKPVKEKAAKRSAIESSKFRKSLDGSPPKQMFQDSVMDLINVPLPAVLPEFEHSSSVDYFDSKVEKESDFCDVAEESAVFTGQRLNKKMQVYSGAKTVFLPNMLSLHQQCVRTLQNNINLLYETGGIPFEILEPVLERCTPEQLLRIEECNPVYIGVTDHLWGKHCQRDFKDSRLQEYESWKEMFIRLSEERERKLQRLTKSIVSAHSSKPKRRQVKMAFIHSVAKPPRDVRIQQELHGTAVQQPHQPRCSVKAEDGKLRPSYSDPSRSSSSSSGRSNAQDPGKKTKVAPMMAKSLKAFKKQFGRR